MRAAGEKYLPKGLSPRVRGNRERNNLVPLCGGSIPAGAGEPFRRAAYQRETRVYPRGCGGTSVTSHQILVLVGLSPRVRGNLALDVFWELGGGSIPAGAGEPHVICQPRVIGWVYPRGCGGT